MGRLERSDLDDKFRRIEPNRSLADCLIPEETKDSLLRLSRERTRYKVLARHGIKPRNRLLFHGPPGNGKTLTAEALATLFERPLLIADYSQFVNMWLGESEKAVASVFSAIKSEPMVLLFDEADSLLSRRVESRGAADSAHNTCVNLVLTNMDQLPTNVLFIACTNLVDSLDPAIDRRFDAKFEFPNPTLKLKQKFAETMLRRYPIIAQHKKTPAVTAGIKKAIGDAVSFAVLEKNMIDIAREIILGT
jgi:SpoVK/Ycf46/Vps4 family AAA+-type ATPase